MPKRTDRITESMRLAQLCPEGHTSASCFYEATHLRWCPNCNVSWFILYDTKTMQYERSKIEKGLLFP